MQYLEDFIKQLAPFGMTKLAQKCHVSESTIWRARQGFAPKKEETRYLMCHGLKLDENELFPIKRGKL